MDKMTSFRVRDCLLEIQPIDFDDLETVLAVYQQCEDFLALGPVSTASKEMILTDFQTSQGHGGLFCGIYTVDGIMIGIVDYVPNHYIGDPQTACISLLMIAASFRSKGLGTAVVEALENEIKKDVKVRTIFSGVQVNNPQAVRFWQRNGYRIVSGPELLPDQTTVFGLQKDLPQSGKNLSSQQ
jgi:ribosomal protein S18 acetylase RimI-like enzyme